MFLPLALLTGALLALQGVGGAISKNGVVSGGLRTQATPIAAIGVGTDLAHSIEVYSTTKNTCLLIVDQISRWTRHKGFLLDNIDTSYSIVLASTEGDRVIHIFGWDAKNTDSSRLLTKFNKYRENNDKDDGLPIALKESSHIYDTIYSIPATINTRFSKAIQSYPTFNIDVYTCKVASNIKLLEQEISLSMDIANKNLPDVTAQHLLLSEDKLSVVTLTTSRSLFEHEMLLDIPEYKETLKRIFQLSVPGTISDITQKSNQIKRSYLVTDVYIPFENN